jgi:hypothetical protein
MSVLLLELEQLLDRNAECLGQVQSQTDGRVVSAPLDREDRLPRDTHLIREILLRHLAFSSMPPHVIPNIVL